MSFLRPAGTGDEAALLALIREFYTIDHHSYDEPLLRKALTPLLEGDEHGVVWLLEDGSGYAVVTWSYSLESGGREALLDEIYVRNRESGTGGRLLQAILADLRERGLRRMFLETERHNKRVRRFYARHGFTEEDSVWMVWESSD
ncbi:MAG: GNAT family N-acetyltransferase [Halieaceae bacterium]|nr:GNAT family N-acetyltransferase [Halieaceae bacterium]